jgi:hypothetical protein
LLRPRSSCTNIRLCGEDDACRRGVLDSSNAARCRR